MNILITGGGGYIGSIATRILKAHGHDIIILDNFSTGHRDAVPSDTRVIEGDVGNFASLVSNTDKVDLVIHLAALISVAESVTKPERYWRNNVIQTLRMLDAMRDIGIKKLIFASTAAVYGNPDQTPITETAAKNPTSPYGMTKLAMDMAISSEAKASGLAAISLRFFNVAGAYEDAGERHPLESHLIPIAFEAARGQRENLMLYGTDYETTDGSCVRDYIHVEDLVYAMLLSIDKLIPSSHSIYNLGNSSGFSNREVIKVIEKVTDRHIPLIESDRRSGDPAILVASSEKARQELGWVPTKPDLETIIHDAWRWQQTRAD